MSNTLNLKTYNPNQYETFDDSLADILIDVLSGDKSLLDRPEIQSLGVNNIKAALQWLKDADVNGDYKDLLAKEGWRLMYYRKPPSPEEFLSWEWIGAQAESTWPNVRKAFVEFMDPNPLNPKRNLALSTSIGWGKSALANLVLTYIIVLFGLMRNPAKLLNKSPMTTFCIVFASATLNKAWDVVGTPFEQFIEQSPFFEKVGRHDDIVKINKEDTECKKCYYTTAARGSSKMVFRNNLNLKLASTEGAILGTAQPLYSKIMLPDNTYTEIGKLKIGDKIKSPTEGEAEVIGIFPQGKRDIFEIELNDGRKVRSSDNHLWKVAIDKDKKGKWNWRIVTTLQLIDWLKEGKDIEIYDKSNAPEVKFLDK